MFVCCECCVLSGRDLRDELIACPRSPTARGASLCVINKPRERGGPGPLAGCRAKNKQTSK